MVNLPKKDSGVTIQGIVVEDFLIQIKTSDGWKIVDTQGSLESMARDIAGMIRDARDIGYQQAQEDIRNALGIK